MKTHTMVFKAICYVIGMVISMLSISRIFIHSEYIYIISAIIGLCIGIYGRLGIDNKNKF